MAQQDILEQAKQGDPKAIAALWNHQLQLKDITVKTTLTSGCLVVIAESEDVPEQEFLIDFIHKSITNLQVKTIKQVVVQGRVVGNSTPVWRESIALQPTVEPTTSQPASISSSSLGSPTIGLKSKANISKSRKLADFFSVVKASWELINTALLLGILLVLTTSLFTADRSQVTLWEYKIESVEDVVFDQVMHRMGAEGWELASARRAVSGENSSSRGLYECIFKRPATKARIRENDQKLEAEVKESALESAQIQAEIGIGSMNQAQQATYLEENTFATTIEELELELQSETENYVYSLTAAPSNSLVTATAKTDGLKSYTGAVFLIQENGETTTVAATCETDIPSRTPPQSPQLSGSEPACPAGSSKVD